MGISKHKTYPDYGYVANHTLKNGGKQMAFMKTQTLYALWHNIMPFGKKKKKKVVIFMKCM